MHPTPKGNILVLIVQVFVSLFVFNKSCCFGDQLIVPHLVKMIRYSDLCVHIWFLWRCKHAHTQSLSFFFCCLFWNTFLQSWHVDSILQSSSTYIFNILNKLKTTYTPTHTSLYTCFQGFLDKFDKSTIHLCNIVERIKHENVLLRNLVSRFWLWRCVQRSLTWSVSAAVWQWSIWATASVAGLF